MGTNWRATSAEIALALELGGGVHICTYPKKKIKHTITINEFAKRVIN
jgi:hypothetical protein